MSGTNHAPFNEKHDPDAQVNDAIKTEIMQREKDNSLPCALAFEIAEKLVNDQAIDDLKSIGPPPYDYKELAIQRRWLTKFYKESMKQKKGDEYLGLSSRKKLLSTPEYSLIDIILMGLDPYFSTKHLWDEEFYNTDLFEQVSSLDVPVYFLAGRYDYFTPSEIVVRYYHKLTAPGGKELIWFENSGHEPEIEEPEKFYDIMVSRVKQVND